MIVTVANKGKKFSPSDKGFKSHRKIYQITVKVVS